MLESGLDTAQSKKLSKAGWYFCMPTYDKTILELIALEPAIQHNIEVYKTFKYLKKK